MLLSKIIESNGLELQTLRVTLQKTQLQNWQFAQSNSQMLAVGDSFLAEFDCKKNCFFCFTLK